MSSIGRSPAKSSLWNRHSKDRLRTSATFYNQSADRLQPETDNKHIRLSLISCICFVLVAVQLRTLNTERQASSAAFSSCVENIFVNGIDFT